jgi:hypothetical protein
MRATNERHRDQCGASCREGGELHRTRSRLESMSATKPVHFDFSWREGETFTPMAKNSVAPMGLMRRGVFETPG